ncbi:MAG TPA: hypothetical protein VGW38_21370 [Chloroflexota bacterium]|nr:hypothetical protein [Chloroflexota bacterium]
MRERAYFGPLPSAAAVATALIALTAGAYPWALPFERWSNPLNEWIFWFTLFYPTFLILQAVMERIQQLRRRPEKRGAAPVHSSV